MAPTFSAVGRGHFRFQNIHAKDRGHLCPSIFTTPLAPANGKKTLHFCPGIFTLNLGEALRAARKLIGLTQDEVAGRAGVNRQIIIGLEAGRGSVQNFIRTADAVDLRIAGLPPARTIGARIKLTRTRRGWTQSTLAERAGLSIPSVRTVERDGGQLSSLQAIIAVIAPAVRTRKSEKANWTAGNRDQRFTPAWLLNEIVTVFGPINLDPCAGEGAAVVADRYITAEEDALVTKWSGELAFMNPPFSAASKFLERAYQAWAGGECGTIIALVPVRTNTTTFHTRCAGVADVILMRGRPAFINPAKAEDSGQVPFGLMLIIWGGCDGSARELLSRLGGRLMERDRMAA